MLWTFALHNMRFPLLVSDTSPRYSVESDAILPSLALSRQHRCYFVLSIAALCNLKIVVQSVAAAQSLLALVRFRVASHIVCAMGHLSLTGQPPAYIAKHRSTI